MANQPKKYKKFVATAATATLVASAIVPVASAASFKDVPENNEFAPYIDALTEAGIINGYPSTNTFKPGAALTRGQVVKMLGRWVESNGAEVPADWKTKARFTDVPTNHKDQELVKYAALVADEGVFGGAAGKLMAATNITRQQMAKVLNGAYAAVNGESLIEIAEGVDNVRIPDLASARAEYEDAIQALMDLEISSTKSGNFRPLENVTRAQFSKFLYNTINFEASDVAPFEIKAVNSTTVEVIFAEDIENIDKVKFEIDGLKIEDAVVKQTSKRTAVLTTSEQKGGTEYTVKVDGEKAGTFVGIAAVIPTAIDVNTKSVQGVIGEQVTLTAAVKVPEGQSKEGVSVTFNIVNDKNTNEKIEVEAFTNAEGVATYKYTRYYASEDQVAAYATKKSSVVSQAKVYWANKIQLAVTELTAGNELANETKKSYKVTGAANSTYYIAIKENLNVAPDKLTDVKVQNHGSLNFVTPYELSTGGTQFATVTTNANGEGTFTVYGSDLSATPIVYAPESTPAGTNASAVERAKYNAVDLQAQAPTVKFSKVDRLAVTVKAEGTADSAEYASVPVAYDAVSTGGRTYTATVTDKEGKVAPEGTIAYVGFKTGNVAGDVYFSTGTNNFSKVSTDSVFPVRVGKDGKATFRVAGKGATTYVKPTVFLNTAGGTNPIGSPTNPIKLDTADVQQDAEVTYFKSPVVANATLTVKDQYGRTVTSLNAGQEAYFTYQSVDQNGFAYRPTAVTSGSTTQVIWVPVYGKDATGNDILLGYEQKTVTTPGSTVEQYNLTFDVTSLFGNATVKDAGGGLLNPSQNQGNTKTYQVKSDAEGKAVVRVTSAATDTVSVNVTGASNFLPTQTASVSFTNAATVPTLYTGIVESYDKVKQTLKFADKDSVSYVGTNVSYRNVNNQPIATADDFIAELAKATGAVKATYEVKDGVTTFYILSTTEAGSKPVDTVADAAADAAATTALNTAKAAATTATTNQAKYTTASFAAYTTDNTAANNMPETTTAEKTAKTTAINAALAKLKTVVTATANGLVITFTPAISNTAVSLADVPATATASDSATIASVAVAKVDGTTSANGTATLTITYQGGKTSADIVDNSTITLTGVKINDVTKDVVLTYEKATGTWKLATPVEFK